MLLLSMAVTLSSCSYQQFSAVATGSTVGGMFGSSIGAIMGGQRGFDKGTIAGMVIGGVAGAVITAPHTPQTANSPTQPRTYSYNSSEMQYDSYSRYEAPYVEEGELRALEVSNLHFIDSNNNQRLDKDEKAYIVFDIYNHSGKTLYNVAPDIVCNSKRVVISSPASVASVLPGQGIRYKAAIVPVRRLRGEPLNFEISFGSGAQKAVAKCFTIETN